MPLKCGQCIYKCGKENNFTKTYVQKECVFLLVCCFFFVSVCYHSTFPLWWTISIEPNFRQQQQRPQKKEFTLTVIWLLLLIAIERKETKALTRDYKHTTTKTTTYEKEKQINKQTKEIYRANASLSCAIIETK